MSRASGLKAVAVVFTRLINSPATPRNLPSVVVGSEFLISHMNETHASDDLWYYAEGENTFGPYSFSELQGRQHRGEITGETLVVPAGQQDWLPLHSVRAHHSLSAPHPASAKKDHLTGIQIMAGLVVGLLTIAILAGGNRDAAEAHYEQEQQGINFSPVALRDALISHVGKIGLTERLHFKPLEFVRGEKNDYAQIFFDQEGLAMTAATDKQSGRVKDITILTEMDRFESIVDFMILPLVVVHVLSPHETTPAKEQAKQAIIEAVQSKGESKIYTVNGLRMKASVQPTMSKLMFYIESN